MKTLIENAIVLTMDDEMRVFDRGYVLTDGANIAEVGAGRFAGDADERIDARGGILLPGFVNTHCHVSMVPFRTMGDDCPDRLRRFLFPLENEAMTRELVYRGAVFGIGEMLLAGVTTFVDMYYFEDEVAGLKSPGGCLIHGGAKRWCARLSRRTARPPATKRCCARAWNWPPGRMRCSPCTRAKWIMR